MKNAQQFIEERRSGTPLDKDVALERLRYPRSDDFSELIEPGDEDWLLELARSERYPLAKFGIHFLRRVKNQPGVRDFEKQKWAELSRAADREGKLPRGRAVDLQMTLMWRLLDYPDLDEQYHRDIHECVKANFGYFLWQYVWYIGGDMDDVLDAVRQRLGSSKHPATKDWIYLCGACGAPDEEEARELIGDYRQAEPGFVAYVANELLSKPALYLPS